MKKLLTILGSLWIAAHTAVGAPAVQQLATGGSHTCALQSDGLVRCWGLNQYGQLGLGDQASRGDEAREMGDQLAAMDFGGRAVRSVTAGADFTCVLTTEGDAICVGDNRMGQLGVGHSESVGDTADETGAALAAVDIGTRTLAQMSAGEQHVCGLSVDAQVLCWGNNSDGQLGVGDTASRGTDPSHMGDALAAVDLTGAGEIVSVATGGMHSCALNRDGKVYCWGDNSFGQLGVANLGAAVGDAPGEMGAALQPADLPGGQVVQIEAGFVQTCARYADFSVTCWGFNQDGRLGLGDTVNRGLEEATMGESLAKIDLGRGQLADSLSCGYRSCCARMINRATKCWGLNFFGELGTDDSRPRGGLPVDMGDPLPFVDLGDLEMVEHVAVGEFHSCALLSEDRLKCWGRNEAGQLGLGDNVDRGNQPQTMGNSLPEVQL